MRLVTIKADELKKYLIDPEMLRKAKRPCVLIVKLIYRRKRYSFAVPLRSNINPSTPKEQYFPLPPRKTTKARYRHGIHYAKMFPIDPSKVIYFRTSGNKEAELIKSIINSNEKTIVSQCQAYLKRYETGECPSYSTNIDLLIDRLYS